MIGEYIGQGVWLYVKSSPRDNRTLPIVYRNLRRCYAMNAADAYRLSRWMRLNGVKAITWAWQMWMRGEIA